MVSGPRPEEQVLESHRGLAEQAVGALVQRPGIPDLVHEPDLQMVVEVLADARQRVDDRDAVRLQQRRRARCRRAAGAAASRWRRQRGRPRAAPSRKRSRRPRVGSRRRSARGPPAPRSTATRCACASVSTVRFGRCSTGRRKARTMLHAHAAALVHLEVGVAEVVAAVELGDLGDAALRGGLAPGVEDLPADAPLLDAQLAAGAVELVGPVRVVLDPDEVGQDLPPRPAAVAERRPVVVVAAPGRACRSSR